MQDHGAARQHGRRWDMNGDGGAGPSGDSSSYLLAAPLLPVAVLDIRHLLGELGHCESKVWLAAEVGK